MKKIITILMSILTLMLVAFSGIGCSIEWQFESDGKFKYYYLRSSDGYAIVGTEETGFSDPMYIPAYYKGKPIVTLGYAQASYMGTGTHYSIDYGTAQKRYYPFTLKTTYSFVGVGEKYIPSTESNFQYVELSVSKINDIVIYLTPMLFKKTTEKILSDNMDHKNTYGKELFEYIEEDYSFKFGYLGSKIKMVELKMANTSYMFNYGDAPNNGYFFINHYNEGELIQSTPYEPMREGYKFEGWYKETECTNMLNTENDSLVDYEMGIKLYAKWIKN